MHRNGPKGITDVPHRSTDGAIYLANGLDEVIPAAQAREMAAALASSGVPHELFLMSEGHHGLSSAHSYKGFDPAFAFLSRWIDSNPVAADGPEPSPSAGKAGSSDPVVGGQVSPGGKPDIRCATGSNPRRDWLPIIAVTALVIALIALVLTVVLLAKPERLTQLLLHKVRAIHGMPIRSARGLPDGQRPVVLADTHQRLESRRRCHRREYLCRSTSNDSAPWQRSRIPKLGSRSDSSRSPSRAVPRSASSAFPGHAERNRLGHHSFLRTRAPQSECSRCRDRSTDRGRWNRPVLWFQCQGYGDSEHERFTPSIGSHVQDTIDATHTLRTLVDVASIGIIGAKFGGSSALLAGPGAGAVISCSSAPIGAGCSLPAGARPSRRESSSSRKQATRMPPMPGRH